MIFARKLSEEIKSLILEGHTKEVIQKIINKKYGNMKSLSIFYDCCYNTLCQEQGINRKKGEELKVKKSRPNRRVGK